MCGPGTWKKARFQGLCNPCAWKVFPAAEPPAPKAKVKPASVNIEADYDTCRMCGPGTWKKARFMGLCNACAWLAFPADEPSTPKTTQKAASVNIEIQSPLPVSNYGFPIYSTHVLSRLFRQVRKRVDPCARAFIRAIKDTVAQSNQRVQYSYYHKRFASISFADQAIAGASQMSSCRLR